MSPPKPEAACPMRLNSVLALSAAFNMMLMVLDVIGFFRAGGGFGKNAV